MEKGILNQKSRNLQRKIPLRKRPPSKKKSRKLLILSKQQTFKNKLLRKNTRTFFTKFEDYQRG